MNSIRTVRISNIHTQLLTICHNTVFTHSQRSALNKLLLPAN